MDALARADETLSRARARANVVTPESAISPMDAASTLQIPRRVIQAADPSQTDPEMTMVMPRGSLGPDPGWVGLNGMPPPDAERP